MSRRDELADVLMSDELDNCGKFGRDYALAEADAIIAHDAAHGIHRVSLDDATVERAARALYVHNNPDGGGWGPRVKKLYLDAVRAVLAAAVEAGQ